MATMTRYERAHLRRHAQDYAHRYLGVRRLPPGAKVVARAYADSFTTYPEPSVFEEQRVDPFGGLGRQLQRFRRRGIAIA